MEKTLDQMSVTEIRRECAYRNLPYTASRNDLQCVLENVIRDGGCDPSTTLLPPRPPIVDNALNNINSSVNPRPIGELEAQQVHNVEDNRNSDVQQDPLDLTYGDLEYEDSRRPLTPTNTYRASAPNDQFPDLHTIHYIRSASEEIGAIRQNIRTQTSIGNLELRITALETALSRVLTNQKNILNKISSIEQDVQTVRSTNCSSFRPVVPTVTVEDRATPTANLNVSRTRIDSQPASLHDRLLQTEEEIRRTVSPQLTLYDTTSLHQLGSKGTAQAPLNSTSWDLNSNTVNNRLYDSQPYSYSVRHTENDSRPTSRPNRTVQFENDFNDSSSTRVGNQSLLIPFNDLKAARASLSEFSGTKEEDPTRFVANSECILREAKIHPAAWVRAVEPQLTGTAAAWWRTVKALDMSWPEFKGELAERFNCPDIQSRLRAEIVSVRQGPHQRLTDFVMEKNQLSRRIQTGLSEPQIVSTIVGLMRDEFRIHARLQHPASFTDLRRIAAVLDSSSYSIQETQDAAPPRDLKKSYYPPTKSKPVDLAKHSGAHSVNNTNRKPPLPCKHCKGPHWNSECPTKPSGNGPKPRGS